MAAQCRWESSSGSLVDGSVLTASEAHLLVQDEVLSPVARDRWGCRRSRRVPQVVAAKPLRMAGLLLLAVVALTGTALGLVRCGPRGPGTTTEWQVALASKNAQEPCKDGDPCTIPSLDGPEIDSSSSWKVVYDNLNVRQKPDLQADILSTKALGDVIHGEQEGDWVHLQDEPGFVKIGVSDGKFLEHVAQQKPSGGSSSPATPKKTQVINEPAQCAGSGEDCSESKCCSQPGLQCYQKAHGWASCKIDCAPGAPDPADVDGKLWSCKELGTRTPGTAAVPYVKPGPWVESQCAPLGENCTNQKCCAWAGMQCYEKMPGWATCKPSCMPGPDLMDVNPDPWSCARIGLRTPGSPAVFNSDIAGWVHEKCSNPTEDCRSTRCCQTPGTRCFEKNGDWATCRTHCEPGVDANDVNKEPWSCRALGPMWTTTSTSTTTTTTMQFPSLFCFAVSRGWGYEPDILRQQLGQHTGIFACDLAAVLSSDPLTLSANGHGAEVLHFEPAPVGKSKDNTAGNALLFMHVWDAINSDGRFRTTDWTVKVDPDAVLIPSRLRTHLKASTGQNVFVRNCNAYPGTADFPMMYGSLEVLSKQALSTYFDGKWKCDAQLPWPSWGEDYYLGKCLLFLGVSTDDDFGIISDGVCTGVNCNDGNAAAFHPFKSVDSWMGCYNTATGAR